MKTKGRLLKAFDYALMAVVIFISLAPLLWVVFSSFKTNKEILSSAFSLPSSFYLEGYAIAMEKANIAMRFLTSVIVAVSSTLLAVFVYALAAYVLARMQFKGRDLLFFLFLSTMLIPGNAMLQPIYFVVRALGLYDTKSALILVYTGFSMALSLALMRSAFLGIPRELEEAAYLDGAGFFRAFMCIMLPVSKSALASAAILAFMGSWNEFLYALMLTSSESNRTLPLMIKYFTSTFSFNYTSMFAALVLSIAPTLLMYVLLQEKIAESMVAGSVKG